MIGRIAKLVPVLLKHHSHVVQACRWRSRTAPSRILVVEGIDGTELSTA